MALTLTLHLLRQLPPKPAAKAKYIEASLVCIMIGAYNDLWRMMIEASLFQPIGAELYISHKGNVKVQHPIISRVQCSSPAMTESESFPSSGLFQAAATEDQGDDLWSPC